MSFESDLFALLSAACPRVFPDVAKLGTAAPYLTWQSLGGKPLRYLNNLPADKRHTLLQINAWATTRMEATALIRQIENALCASAAFIGTPEGEAMAVYEDDTELYGSIQRFNIFSSR